MHVRARKRNYIFLPRLTPMLKGEDARWKFWMEPNLRAAQAFFDP